MREKLAEIRCALEEGRFESAFRICQGLRQKGGAKTDPEVLYLGACALFGLGHVHQAEEWVQEHSSRTANSPASLYLSAYIKLHARQFQEALLDWTRILQLDPSQTRADVLIEKMKSGEGAVFQEVRRSEQFSNFVPLSLVDAEEKESRVQKKLNSPVSVHSSDFFRSLTLIFSLVILILSIFGSLFYYRKPIIDLFRGVSGFSMTFPTGERDRADFPDAPENVSVVPQERYTENQPRFIYPDKEDALADYRLARKLAAEGFTNKARFLLGKIELSNVSFELKERALLFRDLIPVLEKKEFKDNLTPDAALKEPYIYRDSQIYWEGEIVFSGERNEYPVIKVVKSPVENFAVELIVNEASKGRDIFLNSNKGDKLSIFGIFKNKKDAGILRVEVKDVEKK